MKFLEALTGTWQGEKRLWFEDPQKPELSGLSLEVSDAEIAYSWAFRGEPQTGKMDFAEAVGGLEVSWTDTWHSPSVMKCLGTGDAAGFDVTGSYSAGDGSPDWYWRIMALQENGGLVVRMFNIPPEAEEIPAVEMRCSH